MSKLLALLGCNNLDDLLIRPITPFGIAGVVFIIAGIVVIYRGCDSDGRFSVGTGVSRAKYPIGFWIRVSMYFIAGIAFIIGGIVKTLRGEVY